MTPSEESRTCVPHSVFDCPACLAALEPEPERGWTTIERLASSSGDGELADELHPADVAMHPADVAMGKWLAGRKASEGFLSYADAFGMLCEDLWGAPPPERRQQLASEPIYSEVQRFLSHTYMRAHHVHLPVQVVSPSMLFDPGWIFDPIRSVCWQKMMPEQIENMLWIEVSKQSIRAGLEGIAETRLDRVAETPEPDGPPPEASLPERELTIEELRVRHAERHAEQAQAEAPRCKICESSPVGRLVGLDGAPAGWRAIGRLGERLIFLCEPCLNLVRRI